MNMLYLHASTHKDEDPEDGEDGEPSANEEEVAPPSLPEAPVDEAPVAVDSDEEERETLRGPLYSPSILEDPSPVAEAPEVVDGAAKLKRLKELQEEISSLKGTITDMKTVRKTLSCNQ